MLNDLVVGGQRFLLTDIIANVAIAFVLGAAVAIVYRRTHKSFNYSVSFVNTLVILPMITAIVMMVIGNNLARAFGLVGAMSIIRIHLIALAGTGLVILLIVALYAGNFGSVRSQDLLLRFAITPDERGSMLHEQTFRKYLRKHTLLNIQTRQEGEILELSYFVRLKAPEQIREFVRALGAVDGIEGVSLIAMEETAEA
jgi:hypothetical protein